MRPLIDSQVLRDFLTGGTLRQIRPGSPEASVRRSLGEPDEEGVGGRGVKILSYADRLLQISVMRGQVTLIGLYFHRPGTAPLTLSGSEIPFGRTMTAAAFEGALEKAGIAYELDGPMSTPGQVSYYRVGPCLAVVDDGLYSIQAS